MFDWTIFAVDSSDCSNRQAYSNYARMLAFQWSSYKYSCDRYWMTALLGQPNVLVLSDFAHGTSYWLTLVAHTLQRRSVNDERSLPTMDGHSSVALALFPLNIVRKRDDLVAIFDLTDLVLTPVAHLYAETRVQAMHIDGALEIPPNFVDIILHCTIFACFAYSFPLDEQHADNNFVNLAVQLVLVSRHAAVWMMHSMHSVHLMQHAIQFDATEWAVSMEQTVLFVILLFETHAARVTL